MSRWESQLISLINFESSPTGVVGAIVERGVEEPGVVSYYRILGVGEEASDQDITTAYRMLIKNLHPDTNPGDPAAEELFKEHFNEVVLAYSVLSDASKRKAYD